MALAWQTVAIPFAQGIQPSSQARLLEMQKLLRAENVYYQRDNGPQKRNGHIGRAVVTNAPPFSIGGQATEIGAVAIPPPRETYSLANPNLPAEWYYGWGLHSVNEEGDSEASEDPRVGLLFGQAQRDNEVVSWDGHRLFSYAPNQTSNFGQVYDNNGAPSNRGFATLPALNAQPYAKTSVGQLTPDGADNGVVRTAAWVEALSTPTTLAWVTTDYTSGAILSSYREVLQTPAMVRVMTVGPWTHVLVSDTTANELLLRSFHQDTPTTVVSRSLGTFGTAKNWDCKKYNESYWAVARVSTAATAAQLLILKADGSTFTSWNPALGGTTIVNLALNVTEEFEIGFVWSDSAGNVKFRQYTQGGFPVCAVLAVHTASEPNLRLTLTPMNIKLLTVPSSTRWRVFIEDQDDATTTRVLSYTVDTDTSVALRQTRHQLGLASHAFTVGNKAFVWCRTFVTLQPAWYLCDQELLPVGRTDFAIANVGSSLDGKMLPSVNWQVLDPEHPYKDRIVWSGCLPYRERVDTVSSLTGNPSGVYKEPSIRYYTLDFLPKLRSAQAGRSTFFAGAQLWQYDGAEITEAGFHMAPEPSNLQSAAGSGALGSSGTYQYRVDLCHKNAQNEEVRSWSVIKSVTTGATHNEVTLTIPQVSMTRREDSYFLVYRTEKNLTSFYLVSSRNPADSALTANKFLKNDRATANMTFLDRLADTAIVAREYHPANSAQFIEPLPAPACEIVAAGRDRLWLAGGELAPGELAPSRLFSPNECPAFSPALNIQVDRGAEPITAIGFTGKIAAIFRRNSIYTIEGDGPDNVGEGAFFPAQLALSDVGAISQESVVLAAPGLFFQSAAGIRLLSPAGQLLSGASGATLGIGTEVDPLSVVGNYAAAIVVPGDNQIRWYSRDPSKPTLVYNYQINEWVTWTGVACVGACFWSPGKVAVLSRADGRLWQETPGLYTDDDRTYEQIVRVAWLRANNLGDFQRVSRIALFGEAAADLNLRIRYFYNEQPFHEEEQVVAFSDSAVYNSSSWGDLTWGAGQWGDDANTLQSSLFFHDGVFRLRKMPKRQKCSVFSVELSDQGNTSGGFIPTVLALRLGAKPGLDRIPS